ncbi:hypothetical protein MPSEU_000861800 [Mayamaea pseudoterrestris]|nr:hypothetical protein MPSEU_000861800 [Mayamaea pseudoterrestris]
MNQSESLEIADGNLKPANGLLARTDDDAPPPQLAPHSSSLWKRWILKRLQHLLQQDDIDNERFKKKIMTVVTALTIMGCYAGYRRLSQRQRRPRLQNSYHQSAQMAPLSLLLQAAKNGSIQKALLSSTGSAVYFLMHGGNDGNESEWKQTRLPPSWSSKDLMETTLASCADVSTLPEPLWSQLASPLLAAVPFVYLGFLYKYVVKPMLDHGGSDMPTRQQTSSSHATTTNPITFKDVAGMSESTIQDVKQVVEYLHHYKVYQNIGAKPPQGVLLHGPPGTGKTLLAQAVAGEAKVDCFVACSASDFVEVYVGRGAARVRTLFEQTRSEARKKHQQTQSWWDRLPLQLLQPRKPLQQQHAPSAILFIDELDALGKTRATLNSNDEREQALNQLLVELDGFRRSSDVTLVVMAASNRVDVLDPAILRRFDRQIHVGLPDHVGREEILKVHARQIRCGPGIIWSQIASDAMTFGFSGADIRNLVNESALLAVREQSSTVNQSHLEQAARRISRMKRHSVGQSIGLMNDDQLGD